jgi:hypothetical protein
LFDLIAEVNNADALRRGADISQLGKISSQEQLAQFSRNTDLPADLKILQRSFNTQAKEINAEHIRGMIEGTELNASEVLNRVKKLLKDDGIKNPSDVEIYGKLISLGEDGTRLRFEPQLGPGGEIIRPEEILEIEVPVNQIEFKLRDVHNLRVYANNQARKLATKSGPRSSQEVSAQSAYNKLADLADDGIQRKLGDEGYTAYRSIGSRYKTQYTDRYYQQTDGRNKKVSRAIFDSKPEPVTGPRLERLKGPAEDISYNSAGTSRLWDFLDLSKVKTQ